MLHAMQTCSQLILLIVRFTVTEFRVSSTKQDDFSFLRFEVWIWRHQHISSIQSIIIGKKAIRTHPPTHICFFMLFIIVRFQIKSVCARVFESVQVCVRVFLCTVCEHFMCNNLATINHFCFFSQWVVFMFMSIFIFISIFLFLPSFCLFRLMFDVEI